MIKQRIAGAAAAFAVLLGSVTASAYDLPSAYWGLNDSYGAAVESQNYPETARYGSQIIELISQEPSNEQTQNILASRAYTTAFAYFLMGDYTNALKYFEMHIPYGQQLGWDENVYIAENFVKQLTPALEVYKHTSTPQKTYGAKNEPNGVLYGETSETAQTDDSMILLYLEYGDTSGFDWANLIMERAQQSGKAVEVALNFPNQADTARSVNASDGYLSSLSTLLGRYTGVPVYLRIGAEMNIWGNTATPDEFKTAFITIANYMRQLPNIATVWSVAHTSTWKSDSFPYTADDFYPGDEYVDWVGVNCYPNKYFDGQVWEGESKFNEICFKAGYSADPVLMVRDIIETYGGRKPIMISECGSAYMTTGSINESHGDWAAYYVKQMYSYLPMVYPEVKLMAYFNKKIDHEKNYYDLAGSSELSAAYNEITSSPWLIHGGSGNSAQTFFEKADGAIQTDGSLTLSTYPHLYGSDSIQVEYYLDGGFYHSTSEVPYTVSFDDMIGSHTLTVKAVGNNGAEMTREYSISSSVKADSADDFSDTQALSAEQKAAVDYMMSGGIITGYEDNTLRPDNTVTRAEFATMICRLKGYSSDTACTFDDARDHWATNYIEACVKQGAVNGVGDNNFAPDGTITLEQAAKIITVIEGFAQPDEEYPDGFLSAATANGLFDNVTDRRTGSQLKRIDAAMMMYNAVK